MTKENQAGQPASRLAPVLGARSVAVVGASSDPAKITGRPLAYMLARGFNGELYAVNSGRSEVQGLPAYPSLAAIGKPIDLAIVGTAASQVEGVIAEGIAAGVKAFVVFSSGFAETGADGGALQRRLAELARRHGVTILGPNCLGVANSASGLIASFTTALEDTPLQRGAFALVSQSGALGAYWLDLVLRSGLGFSHWITTGNECDADAAEAIDFLVDDPDTRVIGLYVEDIRNTLAFRRALQRAAAAGKPVITIKSGRSQAGAQAAASHTGALAGDDALYDACLRQYGALRVDSLSAMVDAARLFLYDSVPAGSRLGIMSVSGGAGVLMADEAEARGMTVAALDETTCAALRSVLPSFARVENPVDLTGNVVQDTGSFASALAAVAGDPGLDAVMLFVGMMHSIAPALTEAIASARRQVQRPIVVVWMSALPQTIATLERHRIPVFTDIPQAMRALSEATGIAALQAAGRAAPLPQSLGEPAGGSRALSEWEGKQWLAAQSEVGLPQGLLLAEGTGMNGAAPDFPLVAKLQSPQLLHKSDAGAVILKIDSAAALEQAVARLFAIGRELAIPVQGVLVERMLGFDHELLLGLRRDPRFGAVLTIARGGVEVELDADAVTCLLPLSPAQIEGMLRRLRSAPLLQGFRGRPGLDFARLAQRIAALSQWFLEQEGMRELEINPLALRGDQAWALDALVSAAA